MGREHHQTDVELEIQECLFSIQQELARRQQNQLDSVLFFPVTGGEGCGKTTLLRNLEKRLHTANIDVATIKMMGGNPLGDLLRQVILSTAAGEADAKVMTALLQASMETAAATAQQLTQNSGLTPRVILCDRSPYDTGVYQYIADSSKPDEDESDDQDELYYGYQYEQARIVTEQNKNIFTNRGIAPTKTVWIDLDPRIGLARKAAQDEENRFEKKGLRYHKKVRKGFAYFKKHPDYTDSIVSLDGTRTPEQLIANTLACIHQVLVENTDRVIIGAPATVASAEYWYEQDIDRALRILNTKVIETMDDAILFANLLVNIFQWLRDGHIQTATTVQQSLLANPMVGYLDRFAYGQTGMGFRQRLSLLDIQDVIANGWRDAGDLLTHVIKGSQHAHYGVRYDMFPFIEEEK